MQKKYLLVLNTRALALAQAYTVTKARETKMNAVCAFTVHRQTFLTTAYVKPRKTIVPTSTLLGKFNV